MSFYKTIFVTLFFHFEIFAQDYGKIVFLTEIGDRNWKIMTIDANGKNEQVLTNDSSKYALPSWSPDGEKIIFYNHEGDDYDIFMLDVGKKNIQQLTNYKSAYFPRWSPDGKWIAFEGPLEGDEEVYIIRPDGTGLKRLTYSKGLDRNPSWSPDSKQIAFASKRDGNYEIYILPIDSPEKLKRITNTPDIVEKFPAWSPDGKSILFHLQSYIDKKREYAIYMMNVDGTERKKIKDDVEMASWSPDGKKIVFDDVKTGNIFTMKIDGTDLKLIFKNGSRNCMPYWSFR